MDGAPLLKRPKPTDNEEELFRMQEEFLSNKQQPSAKVINLRGSTNTFGPSEPSKSQPDTSKVRSRYSQLKKLRTQDRVSTSQSDGEVLNPVINERIQENLNTRQESVQNVPIAPSSILLGNIVEKKFNSSNYNFNKKESLYGSSKGFPEVFIAESVESKGKQSLFLQQVSREQAANKVDEPENVVSLSTDEGSTVIEGSWSNEIHEENLEKLSHMTEEDILREKKKLEMTLNPELIEFLRNRKNKKQRASKDKAEKRGNLDKESTVIHMDEEKLTSKESSIMQNDPPKSIDKMDIEHPVEESNKDNSSSKNNGMQVDEPNSIPKPSAELLEQAKKKGWVHMDSLEPVKLKWMEDVPAQSQEEPATYTARFDFNGILLPYTDENVSPEKGLHHHGEEPDRPGYSLQELLQLSRSSSQQQRCTALTTLANIIEKTRKGWYDKALQPGPMTALNQVNLMIMLRFSLDDTPVAVITATLQALRALLYSEVDEVCLDRLYGFDNYKEPVLKPPGTDQPDTSDLKDHELAQLDAVASLLRTDILSRIRYILSEIRPPPVGVTCAFEVLTRLARHSPITALNVASAPHLLDTIVEHFLPLSPNSLATLDAIDNVYGVPVTAAIRFCRVLLCYGGKPVALKLNRLQIMQRILSYISCDAGKSTVALGVESLRFWRLLLLHGEATDTLTGAQLILVSQLQLLLCNHDIQSASELSCEYAAALLAVAGCLPPLRTNVSVLLRKWVSQLRHSGNLTLTKTKLVAEAILAADDVACVRLGPSRTQLFQKLCSTSNLLCGHDPAKERDPSCMLHLGVLAEDGQLQPVVSTPSCFPFLATTFNLFVNQAYTEEIYGVLSDPQVDKYLRQLVATDWSLERSWYTRSELSFLANLVNGAALVKGRLDNETVQRVWKVAVKLVSALPADCSGDVKTMLRNALSEDRLSLGAVADQLERLDLDSGLRSIRLNFSRDVAAVYESYVPVNGQWDQAAMPKDWIYLPVVQVYAKCRDNGNCDEVDAAAVSAVLSLELALPDLVDQLSQSLRFSRLVLVYLCDTVYLSDDVSALLSRAVANLLRSHHKSLDFSTQLPGLNSFTDLFTAMCEHFCSTSYGDYGFSMTLMVPIAQRHDVHYRRLLWSEHAGSLRYIRLLPEQLVVPLTEYLYPVEEDVSLIESYITALIRGTVRKEWCPIPHAIATHHSAMFLKRSSRIAARMRTQLAKIPDKDLAALLLDYEAPASS
nr:RNA polymerase II-associated protein 1 [Megalopta genalis]